MLEPWVLRGATAFPLAFMAIAGHQICLGYNNGRRLPSFAAVSPADSVSPQRALWGPTGLFFVQLTCQAMLSTTVTGPSATD